MIVTPLFMYKPIADYALVGDCHGAALVARDTSIDWCGLGRFDADPVFCRLLDEHKGGFLRTAPEGAFRSERWYLPRTSILRTTLSGASGRVAIADFIPVGRKPGARVHDYLGQRAPFWLVRMIEGLEERVPVQFTEKRVSNCSNCGLPRSGWYPGLPRRSATETSWPAGMPSRSSNNSNAADVSPA